MRLLDAADNDYLIRALADYSRIKRPSRLILALKTILDTDQKRTLVAELCRSLIPVGHRPDILAAFAPANCSPAMSGNGAGQQPIAFPASPGSASMVFSMVRRTKDGPLGLSFTVRVGNGRGIFNGHGSSSGHGPHPICHRGIQGHAPIILDAAGIPSRSSKRVSPAEGGARW